MSSTAGKSETTRDNGDSSPARDGRGRWLDGKHHRQRSKLKRGATSISWCCARDTVRADTHPHRCAARCGLRRCEALRFSGTEPHCRCDRVTELAAQLGRLREVKPAHEHVRASDTVLRFYACHGDDLIVEVLERAARDVKGTRAQHQPKYDGLRLAGDRGRRSDAARCGMNGVVRRWHSDATKHAPKRAVHPNSGRKLRHQLAGHLCTNFDRRPTRCETALG